MIVYIKRHKDFSLAGKADAESWNLPLEAVGSESGSVVIMGENRDCVGDWLVIMNKVVLITQAQPKDGKTTLATADPFKDFDRQLFFPANPEATYGAFIKSALEREFLNCPDDGFRLPYLKVTSTDNTTLVKPDLDETNLFKLSNVIAAARRRGVFVDFSLGQTEKPADTLNVTISRSDGNVKKVFFNDGHAQLSSETYSPNGIAKITIMQEQEQEQDAQSEQRAYQLFDFWLTENGDVVDSQPTNPAFGRWEYATCQADDTPLRRAAALFSDNLASHKIEFYADYQLHLYDTVLLRLHGGVYQTSIIYVGVSSKDNRYQYKCGELAVTLTDKVRQNNSGSKTVLIQQPEKANKSDIPDVSGKADKSEVDEKADKSEIPTKTSQLTNDSGFATLLAAYPVGSIYMSVNSTNPQSLFGGTWEQIQGRFLLAAGGGYNAGSTGGEATHALTVEELPQSIGSFKMAMWNGDKYSVVSVPSAESGAFSADDIDDNGYGVNYSTGSKKTRKVKLSGGGQAMNNMPPYLAVYVWKRTA